MPEYIALQLTTLILGVFTSVLLYRIVRNAQSYRIALAVGLGSGLATPMLFWMNVPKRHVVFGALAVLSMYFLFRSRSEKGHRRYLMFRALAYVPIGLAAWVFVVEGGILFTTVVVVDVVTARENSLKSISLLAGSLLLSCIPMFMTNWLISGSPLTSPMMLPDYPVPTSGGGGGSSSQLSGITKDSAMPSVIQKLLFFGYQYWLGIETMVLDPGRVYHTFIRSGFINFGGGSGLAINVSFIESLPLTGALVGAPIAMKRFIQNRGIQPIHTVDAFVLLFSTLTILIYIPYLPAYATLTVRYLIPLFPLTVYAIVRLPWVQDVVVERGTWLAWTYTAGIFIGSQLLLAWMVMTGATVDEAIQGYAILNLLIASLLALWSLLGAIGHSDTRFGAGILGVAAAVSTNFILITTIYYFGTKFALPLVPAF